MYLCWSLALRWFFWRRPASIRVNTIRLRARVVSQQRESGRVLNGLLLIRNSRAASKQPVEQPRHRDGGDVMPEKLFSGEVAIDSRRGANGLVWLVDPPRNCRSFWRSMAMVMDVKRLGAKPRPPPVGQVWQFRDDVHVPRAFSKPLWKRRSCGIDSRCVARNLPLLATLKDEGITLPREFT